MFVTFEGPEGAGKTTQAHRLAERLRTLGRAVLLEREPGGTRLGERVREIVLERDGVPICGRAETLLYCVARAQLVEEKLRPWLERGDVVIVDRYADSTLAYQAFGRDLPLEEVLSVLRFATGGLRPNLTFLLDLPVAAGLARKREQIGARPEEWNRFETEALAFHERVRQGYLRLAAADSERWRVLDATGPAEEVANLIWQETQAALSLS